MLRRLFLGFLTFIFLSSCPAHAVPSRASCQPSLHEIDNSSGIFIRPQAYEVIFSPEYQEYAWQDATFLHYVASLLQAPNNVTHCPPHYSLPFDFESLMYNTKVYLEQWTKATPEHRAQLIEDVLEVKLLPEDFSVEILRSQRGVFAKKDINPGDIIGLYTGIVCANRASINELPGSTDEYAELIWQQMQNSQATPRQLWENMLFYTKEISEQNIQLLNPTLNPIETALNRGKEHQEVLMQKALPVFNDAIDTTEKLRSVTDWSLGSAEMVSGKGVFGVHIIPHNRGNATSLLNDFRNVSEKPNVDWGPYYYDGFPYPVVYSISKIKTGEQLLVDYGEGYWKSREGGDNLEYLSFLDGIDFKCPTTPQYLYDLCTRKWILE